MGLVRFIKQILTGELRPMREVPKEPDRSPERMDQQQKAPRDHGHGQIASFLSPEQKQQLMQLIAEKLASEKGDVTLKAKSNSS